MAISEATVRTHVSNILGKLHLARPHRGRPLRAAGGGGEFGGVGRGDEDKGRPMLAVWAFF